MEQKHFFNKKNPIVLVVVIVLIAAAAVVAVTQRKELEPVTEDTRAFLVITVAGEMYEPIELTEEGRYSITRGDMVNEVAVTKDSVTMHSSTCDNQDCVLQGTVTLENRSDRVLQNMILCMPNEVVLELYTDTEVAELLMSMAGYTTEDAADE